MDQYHVVIDGKPQGPFSIEQLKELPLKPGMFVRTPAMDDYKEAHEVPELRELFGFTHSIGAPQYFASLDQRLVATALDNFILFGIVAIVAFTALMVLGRDRVGVYQIAPMFIALPLIRLVYGSIMESSAKQATWGKILLGLKVTDESGNPPTAAQAWGRNFAKITCLATAGIGYVVGFFSKRQQGLHDLMASTLVIKARLM
jgi:uncharacterized RDD family membrane protein YckC